MGKGRLEAFSDGVFAIIITIMVLEIKVPQGHELATLKPLIPVFISYVLSFLFVAIYWNNHHHLMQAVKRVNGQVLWANVHLLFWLSLVPFAAGWMGENDFEKWPVVVYGLILLMSAIAFTLLLNSLKRIHGQDSVLMKAIGDNQKSMFSSILVAAGIGLAFIHPWIGLSIYGIIVLLWLIPSKKIETILANEEHANPHE